MTALTRWIVVTGASRGIGRTTVLYLATRGLSVVAGVRRVEDGAALTETGHGRIRSVVLDVTSEALIGAAVADVERLVAPAGLAGLVNNAGIGGSGPLEHIRMADLEEQFRVNVFGVALTTKAFLPLLRRAQGRIVNVGAANARLAIPLMGGLSATKFALEGMSDALRVELRRAGIRVALVEPGMTYAAEDQPRFAQALDTYFERVLQTIPEPHRGYYQTALERARSFNRSMLRRASPPEVVARQIHHALASRHPRARYWCGTDGKLAGLIGLLAPARVRDMMWRRVLGL